MRQIGFTFRDHDGDSTSMVVFLPDGTATLAELETYAQMYAALVDATSDAVIDKITLTIKVDLPGTIKVSPVQYSEVQKGGLMSFGAAGTDYRHSLRVPAMKPNLFSGNSIIDGVDPVLALKTAMLTGIDVGGKILVACDKYENDLNSFISGTKSFRRK